MRGVWRHDARRNGRQRLLLAHEAPQATNGHLQDVPQRACLGWWSVSRLPRDQRDAAGRPSHTALSGHQIELSYRYAGNPLLTPADLGSAHGARDRDRCAVHPAAITTDCGLALE
jgi:hypothetical protein